MITGLTFSDPTTNQLQKHEIIFLALFNLCIQCVLVHFVFLGLVFIFEMPHPWDHYLSLTLMNINFTQLAEKSRILI